MFSENAGNASILKGQGIGDIPAQIKAWEPVVINIDKSRMKLIAASYIQHCNVFAPLPFKLKAAIADQMRIESLNLRVRTNRTANRELSL
jgi:poly(A) polymerase Pap1